MIATWVWVKQKPPGIGPQVLNHQRTTGFSPWFLLPGQPILGTHFLTHSHLCVLSYSGCYSSWPTTSFEQPAVPKWTQDSTGELRELDFRPRKDIETRRQVKTRQPLRLAPATGWSVTGSPCLLKFYAMWWRGVSKANSTSIPVVAQRRRAGKQAILSEVDFNF